MTTSLSSRQALESPGFSRGEDVNKTHLDAILVEH